MLGTIEKPEFRLFGVRVEAGTMACGLSLFLRVLASTARVARPSPPEYYLQPERPPIIFTFWHDCLLGMLLYSRKHYRGPKRGIAITSAS